MRVIRAKHVTSKAAKVEHVRLQTQPKSSSRKTPLPQRAVPTRNTSTARMKWKNNQQLPSHLENKLKTPLQLLLSPILKKKQMMNKHLKIKPTNKNKCTSLRKTIKYHQEQEYHPPHRQGLIFPNHQLLVAWNPIKQISIKDKNLSTRMVNS